MTSSVFLSVGIKKFFPIISLLLLFCLLAYKPLLYAHTEIGAEGLSGVKSLLAVFKTLGVKSNLDELEKLSGYDRLKGATMAGLSRAVEKRGLYASEVKMSIDELAKLKMPVIVCFWGDSFQAVDKIEKDKVRVIDPENEPVWKTRKYFTDNYSGRALLVSKDKTSFPEMEIKGPDIRFDEYVYNFGVIKNWEGSAPDISHVFKFKNMGNKELEISRVRASCGCTATILSEKNIPPQNEGEIKVNFNVGRGKGVQSTNVYVFSNDSITPMVKLQIKGIVSLGSEFSVTPQNIRFNDLKKHTTATQKLYITPLEYKELNISKIESSSEYISAKLFEHETKGFIKSFEIEVSINADFPLDEFNEKIIVYTTDKEISPIEIPVTGNIIGDIEIHPSRFFFGLAGEILQAKVIILNSGEKPLIIERIDNPFDFISLQTVVKIEGKEYELTAFLKENTSPERIKGRITVYTNNPEQKEIKIPVYCLVNTQILSED